MDTHDTATPATSAKPRFTIELSETELKVVAFVLGRFLDPKPVRAKPARTSSFVEPFNPDTGDPDLDAFMRASRARRGKPKALPAIKPPTFPHGNKIMTDRQRADVARFNDLAIARWRKLGHEVIIDRLVGQQASLPALDGRNVRVLPLESTANEVSA